VSGKPHGLGWGSHCGVLVGMKARTMLHMNNVIGTWRLLSVQMVFSDGGESVDMYGAEPDGFLIITPITA
jgi:hypothetical protein